MAVEAERGMIDDREYARQHALPRIVWQCRGFRLVQYVDDYERVALGLERREGTDYLGQERWAMVSWDGAPADGWGWVRRDWRDAFDALAGCLFAPGCPLLELPLIVGDDDAQGDEDGADIPY